MGTIDSSLLVWNVNTGTVMTPVWTAIAKVESANHSPSTVEDDISHLYSGDRDESRPMRRGDEFTLEGIVEDVSGTRDAGQAAVEALAAQTADAAVGQFQVSGPTGFSREFDAWVESSEFTQDKNRVLRFSYRVKVTGDVTKS